ncbi:thiamine-phosphate synthase [Alsobacter metallidurans]|uniref:Thiamine-phosphate synthase n=1 Tax=Alsobacter metallidurans TaxID=340221 RepID=A0A917I2S8_9HYPH|nr:thiamine phosphate synthase [Alsobacter metallidurans]GGH06605.1 thiamine-phosphate synthase [Alsobacter metallidurans]
MGKAAFDLSLYFVTDPVLVQPRGLLATVAAAVRGGATLVQLRDKTSDDQQFAADADALLGLLRPLRVPLIVNDRVVIAKAVGADGVHIGQNDGDPRRVRDIIGPDMILGLSAGTEAEFAAVPEGVVDYLGVGPIRGTGTKPDHDPPIGVDGLARLLPLHPLPKVAIGGVGPANTHALIATGVDGIAVVSAICSADDPEAATRDLVRLIRQAREGA